MIKKLLTIAALALPLMAANAQESVEKVVFEEDFSLMTKGEVGAPADDIICEDGVIKSEYTHKAGWQATAAKSAGGSVYIPNDGSHTLLSPIINCGASIDGNVTIEFDAYYVDEAEAGGVYIWVRQPNATSDATDQFRSQLIRDKAEQWVHITFSTTAAKPLSSLKDDKSLQVGIRSTYNAIYVKNLKVTINVDPNADVVESTDFAGTYTFKATKEITAPNAQDAKALWLQEEFEFTIAANEGDDVEVYPYVITGFPASFNPNTNAFVEYNALKAKPSADGKSLVLTIGHAGKLQSGSDHPELAGPNGKDDTATELVMSPIADSENYTIEGGFQVINHTEEQWGGIIPASWRNLAKLDDIVITRTGDVDGIDEIVVDEVEKAEKKALEGVYTINGAKVRNTNDATGLQPGFYIIGGEKVIIR